MYDNSLFTFKNSINYLSVAGYKIIVGEDILTFRNGKRSATVYTKPRYNEVTVGDTINANDLRCILDVVDYCQNLIIFGNSKDPKRNDPSMLDIGINYNKDSIWHDQFMFEVCRIDPDIAKFEESIIRCIVISFAINKESEKEYIHAYVYKDKYEISFPRFFNHNEYGLKDNVVQSDEGIERNLELAINDIKKVYPDCIEIYKNIYD